MGRYDKVRVHDGSSWKQPTTAYVYNGSSWVSLDNNTSYSTNSIYTYDGSAWKRATLNRSDYTTYNGAVDNFSNYTGTSKALSIKSGNLTVSTRRHNPWDPGGFYWETYLFGMMNSTTGGDNWWASSWYNDDSTEDWHEFTWSGAKWIYGIRYRTANSGSWQACPRTAQIAYRNPNGTWTGYTSHTIANYTTKLGWGSWWVLNKKGAGFTGIRMRYYNNANYMQLSKGPRIGQFSLNLGTITNGTNWV